METDEEINALMREWDLSVVIPLGWAAAFLGVTDGENPRAVYSRTKIVELLGRDMTPEEAEEYFDFNIERAAQHEENGPLFIVTF